jgi:hypothetical protein
MDGSAVARVRILVESLSSRFCPLTKISFSRERYVTQTSDIPCLETHIPDGTASARACAMSNCAVMSSLSKLG